MELNDFIWENFKQTAEYKYQRESIDNFFKSLCSNDVDLMNSLFEDETSIVKFGICDENAEFYFSALDEFRKIFQEEKNPKKFYQAAIDLDCYESDDDEEPFPVIDYGNIYDFMYLFASIDPENFFFFNFSRETQYLKSIFDNLNLSFPALPKKRDHLGRMLFYLELCESAKEIKNYITCDGIDIDIIFNYFGKKIVPRKFPEMHEPTMAYFVGAGKNAEGIDVSHDFEYLDKINDDTVFNWQGNSFARPGDMFIMYCLSPRSYIHSIWRAVDFGFVDPLFLFYNNTYIGHPKKVPTISISELRKDMILKNLPLVRANMQGINGIRIEKKNYDRILELLVQKGCNIDQLPKLPKISFSAPDAKNERDVEIELIEPLLARLNFSAQEWSRQLIVKIGRNERIIPDYVCLPKFKNNDWSCYWIWESKFSIANDKEVERDFIQAKSYALRLGAKGLCLAAKEGIWFATDYSTSEKLNFFSWNDLENNINFGKLYKVAGNHKK